MRMLKLLVAAFWCLEGANLIGLIPPAYSTSVHWIALVVLGVHLLEWLLLGRRIFADSPSKRLDGVLVLLFGMTHIMPEMRRQMSNTPSDPPALS